MPWIQIWEWSLLVFIVLNALFIVYKCYEKIKFIKYTLVGVLEGSEILHFSGRSIHDFTEYRVRICVWLEEDRKANYSFPTQTHIPNHYLVLFFSLEFNTIWHNIFLFICSSSTFRWKAHPTSSLLYFHCLERLGLLDTLNKYF